MYYCLLLLYNSTSSALSIKYLFNNLSITTFGSAWPIILYSNLLTNLYSNLLITIYSDFLYSARPIILYNSLLTNLYNSLLIVLYSSISISRLVLLAKYFSIN